MKLLVRTSWPATLVDDGTRNSRWQDLQRFEELDEAVAVVGAESFEGLARSEGFAGMSKDGFAHGGEFAVVHEGAGVGRSPELTGDESGVALEEGGGTGGLVLIERFGGPLSPWLCRAV